MLVSVRGSTATPHGVRFPLLLASCILIAGGLLAATCASAQPAGSDSTASAVIPRPAPATPTFVPPTFIRPKPKLYTLHLHGGLFEPIDVNAPSPTLGLRLGRRVVSHLQAGLLVDWMFERKNLTQPVNGLPGLQPHLILARADAQLVPAMVFVHVDLNETRFLEPYAGIATGYEWFFSRVTDFRTGEFAKATYTNWAWQSWGGIGMRLSPDLRVDFEAFYNGGSLERDVTVSSGGTMRESVNANGAGARVGLNILF